MDALTEAVDRARTDRPATGGRRGVRSFGHARTFLRRLWDRAADESGQVLPIVMLALIVIVGVAALAIDEAEMASAHHKAQLAADASALSAAQDLETPGYPTSSLNSNATTIANNNDPGSTSTVSEPDPNTATATVKAPVGLTFGGFFGHSSSTVQASARRLL